MNEECTYIDQHVHITLDSSFGLLLNKKNRQKIMMMRIKRFVSKMDVCLFVDVGHGDNQPCCCLIQIFFSMMLAICLLGCLEMSSSTTTTTTFDIILRIQFFLFVSQNKIRTSEQLCTGKASGGSKKQKFSIGGLLYRFFFRSFV